MMMNRFAWVLLLLFLTSLSCSTLIGETVEEAGWVEMPAYSGPTPQPGTGSVYGQVWWNSEAAANISVLLCENYTLLGDCVGANYRGRTNSRGEYLLTGIAPGTYNLAIRLFNSDEWVSVREGILSAAAFTVTADQTTVIPSQNIYKRDLRPLAPTTPTVPAGPVTLQWRPYESASYYSLILYPEAGDTIFSDRRLENSEIIAELPPQNCLYRWKVEAYNIDAIKIAETDGFLTFAVTGYDGSCILTQLNPPYGESLTSGSGIVLRWEPHHAAATYDILMWNDSLPGRPKTLDFVTTTVPSYHFGQTLEPGRYVWSVRAFDSSGRQVGGSATSSFTVR